MLVFSIIKDNWKSYFLPIFISLYLPLLAYLFNDLNFYIVLSSFFTLAACYMGMVDRDVAKHFYSIAESQREVFTSELIERINERKDQKECLTNEEKVVVTVEIDDGNTKVH